MKIKLCGLSRPCDIAWANELNPDYVGFVFWPKSKRFVDSEKAACLKSMLKPEIKAVGVFVDESIDAVLNLLNEGIIDVPQLHGSESEEYIKELKTRSGKLVFKAFKVKCIDDIKNASCSFADYVLLDAGMGDGKTFDWSLLKEMKRDYFLAGGLNVDNINEAVETLRPFGVDVSSGIETDGVKDKDKMLSFVQIVRKEELV